MRIYLPAVGRRIHANITNKKMKKIDFKTKKEGELQKLLTEKREAVRAFRFGISGSRTKNVKAGHDLRKEIARILTVLNTIKK